MIDKRLIKEMPQAKQFVFKQVFMQWIGICAMWDWSFLYLLF